MATPLLVLFDDGYSLSPLNDMRASFDIRTGALTTIERTTSVVGRSPDALFVPPELVEVTRQNHPGTLVNTLPAGETFRIVNGRCPLLKIGASNPGDVVADSDGKVLIDAVLDRASAQTYIKDGTFKFSRTIDGSLMTRPWHWRRVRDKCITTDLELLARRIAQSSPPLGTIAFGSHPLHIMGSAKIYPGVTFDLEGGPIVIDDRATVRPGSVLIGPCYIGRDSHVLDKSLIKANTAIGPHCKVAGEIGGTIIQGFSNKGHDGHLGDSWLGEWVNLGAGTTNSNLLNTYGEVICRATPDSSNERTAETFLGATIGDHVKSAICTKIMTGAVMHMGSMFAQTAAVSGTVAAFTWATDAGLKLYRFDKFFEVATAAMSRRKISPTPEYRELLKKRHGDFCGGRS